LVKFKSVHFARQAKKRCDGARWYGATLRFEYACEQENEDDIREKYRWRIRWVRGDVPEARETETQKVAEEEKKRIEDIIERAKPLKQKDFEAKQDKKRFLKYTRK
jgi:hypothetical protein